MSCKPLTVIPVSVNFTVYHVIVTPSPSQALNSHLKRFSAYKFFADGLKPLTVQTSVEDSGAEELEIAIQESLRGAPSSLRYLLCF